MSCRHGDEPGDQDITVRNNEAHFPTRRSREKKGISNDRKRHYEKVFPRGKSTGKRKLFWTRRTNKQHDGSYCWKGERFCGLTGVNEPCLANQTPVTFLSDFRKRVVYGRALARTLGENVCACAHISIISWPKIQKHIRMKRNDISAINRLGSFVTSCNLVNLCARMSWSIFDRKSFVILCVRINDPRFGMTT